MSLVRRGKRPYYYESFRRGGRGTSRYVGCGALAEAYGETVGWLRAEDERLAGRLGRRLAALEAKLRESRERQQRDWARQRAALGELEALLGPVFRMAEDAFRGAMT